MKRINKKALIIVSLILGILVIILLIHLLRVIFAKVEVNLKDNLKAEFLSEVKVSDFIDSINGKIIDDYKIDTNKLGTKKIEFKYINDDNIKVKYSYDIKVVDTVEPLIWGSSRYTIYLNDDFNLDDKIIVADNHDKKVKTDIINTYDTTVEGSYDVVYKAIDKSNNEATKDITINVIKKPDISNKSENKEETEEEYIDFNDVVNTYKTTGVKIGIDVSKWQGKIDFKKLKQTNIDFIYIRVGGTRGKDGKFFLDDTFKYNIKQANKYKIPVGVYFNSYAYSSKEAKEQAKWTIKQIKKYKVKLPIAFDWEDWPYFEEYNMSLYDVTNMAENFIKEVNKAGYKGIVYSGKTYLENFWLELKDPVWLAQYASKPTYEKKYKIWQMTDQGKIDGVNAYVDIDLMYE